MTKRHAGINRKKKERNFILIGLYVFSIDIHLYI